MEILSKSLDDTRDFAHNFVKGLCPSESGATVIGLTGELGSGKTCFVKFVADALGIKGTVTSPTFVIEKIYLLGIENPRIQSSSHAKGGQKEKQFKHLIHIDAYRLENSDELKHLGWDEVSSDSNNLIFIEWPERVQSALPKDTMMITFEHCEERSRLIKIP